MKDFKTLREKYLKTRNYAIIISCLFVIICGIFFFDDKLHFMRDDIGAYFALLVCAPLFVLMFYFVLKTSLYAGDVLEIIKLEPSITDEMDNLKTSIKKYRVLMIILSQGFAFAPNVIFGGDKNMQTACMLVAIFTFALLPWFMDLSSKNGNRKIDELDLLIRDKASQFAFHFSIGLVFFEIIAAFLFAPVKISFIKEFNEAPIYVVTLMIFINSIIAYTLGAIVAEKKYR